MDPFKENKTILLGIFTTFAIATILTITEEVYAYSKMQLAHHSFKADVIPFTNEDMEFCQSNNQVLDRGDSLENLHEAIRPYSATNYTFARFHGDNDCKTLDEVLLAIKNGKRRWVDHTHELLPPIEAEEYPSYFVPDGCDLPFVSSHQMCTVFEKFSHVIINGDSLSRHMSQGIFMTLREDLILGGIESSNKFLENNPYQSCRCDGQFSEHADCRQNEGGGSFFNSFTPRDLGLCSHLLETSQFRFRYDWSGAINQGSPSHILNELDCTSPESKDAIWVLQGGVHFHASVESALKNWIDPLFDNQTFKVCRELNKLKIIWVTYGSQSRQLDEKFPHQSRENGEKFSIQMETALKQRIPDIVVIDWAPLTAEAQTSDGFHFLSDVNLVKSSHLVNVMSFLASQA